MLVFVVIAAIAGTLLGLRFKVLVLVPAVFIAAGAVILTGHGPHVIILTVLATAALLQIGYIFGCVIRAYASGHLQPRAPLRDRFSRSEPA